MRMIVVLAVILMPTLACAAGAIPPICGAPVAMSDGWPVAAPAKEGLDPGLICSIAPTLEKSPALDPNGVVVVSHGTLVYEHYSRRYSVDDVHVIQSISKSVVALLAGIASDHGLLTSVDAPLLSFFPGDADLRLQDKRTIAVRDLLTMTSGLRWPEHSVSYLDPSNILERMGRSSDPYRFVLAQRLAWMPGTVWNYNSGGVEVLGDVLMQVSHQRLDNFAQRTLFDPLGIKYPDWTWRRWPDGKLGASWGLCLRPRDLAKIGQLVLNHGAWYGHQVVSAKWIKDMVATQVQFSAGWGLDRYRLHSYGYLWWLGRMETRGRSVRVITGIGFGGQWLYVVPSLDLVIAVTASDYKSEAAAWLDGYTALDIVLRAAFQNGPEAAAPTKPLASGPRDIIHTGQ